MLTVVLILLSILLIVLLTTKLSIHPFIALILASAFFGALNGLNLEEIINLINEGFGKSYTELVNQYRIEKACSLLKDYAFQDQSILEIALIAGFSSKSTFNRLFRAQTGLTPSQYRKEHN